MTDTATPPSGPDFLRWVAPLIRALRTMGGEGRTADVIARMRSDPTFDDDDLSARTRGGNSRFFSNTAFARHYLSHGGLVTAPKRGLWRLTEAGRTFDPTSDAVSTFFDTVRTAQGWINSREEEVVPEDDIDIVPPVFRTDVPPMPDDASYWFAGANWSGDDQTERFLAEGVWENGYDDQFTDLVREMRPGEKIAIKAAFVQKRSVPFDIGGKKVSVMSIKATGTILEPSSPDGKRIRVAWDPPATPRKWYFYTYLTTLNQADMTSPLARALVDFTFADKPQDYDKFLADPYWSKKYRLGERPTVRTTATLETFLESPEDVESELTDEPPYTVASIVADGCFVPLVDLAEMLEVLSAKKNLVLQGPPGTGKTWLAKRLAYALIGLSPKTARDRLRVVQFHPSLSYEDFVRGWRPSGDGRLTLTDGVFLEAVAAAVAEPDVPFVVVIEEINRGNPAQIFGELLTLLEQDKRNEEEALALAYRPAANPLERVFLPDNLYLIGTMNIADRSLALVDLALRRRFAFVTLTPRFDAAWVRQLTEQNGLDATFVADLGLRMARLNDRIAEKLGDQFRIGHSYLTPRRGIVSQGVRWFRGIVTTEIRPLLDEYFYDDPAEATRLVDELLEGVA